MAEIDSIAQDCPKGALLTAGPALCHQHDRDLIFAVDRSGDED